VLLGTSSYFKVVSESISLNYKPDYFLHDVSVLEEAGSIDLSSFASPKPTLYGTVSYILTFAPKDYSRF
jgi:hypothetical protein